jgi:hypothetical protein
MDMEMSKRRRWPDDPRAVENRAFKHCKRTRAAKVSSRDSAAPILVGGGGCIQNKETAVIVKVVQAATQPDSEYRVVLTHPQHTDVSLSTSTIARMKGLKKSCFCTKCGGPNGPGKLLAYSTRQKHRKADIPATSTTFKELLASVSVSGPSQTGAYNQSMQGIENYENHPRDVRSFSETVLHEL